MKISEQARQVVWDIGNDPEGMDDAAMENAVQTAINDHERDLVAAAKMFHQPACKMPAVEYYEAIDALKAALDRRRE